MAKQLCGHPVECIMCSGQGVNACGWCEEVRTLKNRVQSLEAGIETVIAEPFVVTLPWLHYKERLAILESALRESP